MNQTQQLKLTQDIMKIAHQLEDMVCDNCGAAIGIPVFVSKRLPSLHPINPTTQDVTVQLPAGQACFVCGQRNTFTKVRKVGEASNVRIPKEKPTEDKPAKEPAMS